MKALPFTIYREDDAWVYLFCIRGYRIQATVKLFIRFTNQPLFEVWKFLGPCDGSCKDFLIEVPKTMLSQISKAKRSEKASQTGSSGVGIKTQKAVRLNGSQDQFTPIRRKI
jgi:hypothetical protein